MDNTEQVKQALRLCGDLSAPCAACTYKKTENCNLILANDALSVIESQQAEIADLKMKVSNLRNLIRSVKPDWINI